MSSESQWYLDKRVPIVFVFTLLIQTGGLFYWGGQMEATQDELKKKDVSFDTRLSAVENKIGGQAETLVRVDERTRLMQEDIKEIKNNIK